MPSGIDERAQIRAYRRQSRAMLFIGAIFLFVGARFFLDPGELERTTIGKALPGFYDEAWSLLYVAGGALIAWGCERPSPRAERPGITLVLTGLVANFVAIAGVRGVGIALGQVPIYAIATWVLWSRRGDLIAAARRADAGTKDAVETKLLALVPLLPFAAIDTSSLVITIMGGGVIAAMTNAFLFRPQRNNLIAQASDAATQATTRALDTAEKTITRLEKLVADQSVHIEELEQRNSELLETVEDQGLKIATQRDELRGCLASIGRLEQALAEAGT